MHIIVGIIAALIIFAILVIVHEGGHFFTAKAVGSRSTNSPSAWDL